MVFAMESQLIIDKQYMVWNGEKKNMYRLGIDIGTATVKFVLIDENKTIIIAWEALHHNQPSAALKKGIAAIHDFLTEEVAIGVTGADGLSFHKILKDSVFFEDVPAIVEGTKLLAPSAHSIMEIGSQGSRFITQIDQVPQFATNGHCAGGTGSFFEDQMSRLGLSIEDYSKLVDQATSVPRLSGRCAVFAKTDIIHRQQEGVCTPDILLGLCYAMIKNYKATIVRDLLVDKPVAFCGGVTKNRGVIRAIKEVFDLQENELIISEYASFAGAAGAALHASGSFNREQLLCAADHMKESHHGSLPALPESTKNTVSDPTCTQVPVSGKCALGIDIGSTSTDLVIVGEHNELVDYQYLRTSGNPEAAVRKGLASIKERFGELVFQAVGVTGSGRERVGRMLGADAIRDEITAQAAGAAHCVPEVNTVFEIGGQDSKYIQIEDGRVVDFQMNKICAAGTGSFVEEQAARMGIPINEFGSFALTAKNPASLGERCTVFIETAIAAASAEGIAQNEIAAGLCYAIVKNYLHKVVGTKPVGNHIVLQGGVAYNPGIVAAFRAVYGDRLTVNPYFSISGAFGVALLAKEVNAGKTSSFASYEFSGKMIHMDTRSEEVRKNMEFYHQADKLLLDGYTGERDPRKKTVGVPFALMIHKFFPMANAFFTSLGYNVLLTKPTNEETIRLSQENARGETCYPVKLIYGHMKQLIDAKVDYIFLPTIHTMKHELSHVEHNYGCVYMQTAAVSIGKELGLEEKGITLLSPVFDLDFGKEAMASAMVGLGKILGISKPFCAKALLSGAMAVRKHTNAVEKQGKQLLDCLKPEDKVLVLITRNYGVSDPILNMGIPDLLLERGIKVITLSHLPGHSLDISGEYPNLYWPFGQHILSGAKLIAHHPNLYAVYLTNHGCGPDSMLSHLFKKEMGDKPYLQIEVDEHFSKVGVVTRIEAFLNSLSKREVKVLPADFNIEDVTIRTSNIQPKVQKEFPIYLPNIGLYTDFIRQYYEKTGYTVHVMPAADEDTLSLGRAHTNSKEYLPFVVLLGSILKDQKEREKQKLSKANVLKGCVNDQTSLRAVQYLIPQTLGSEADGQYATVIDAILGKSGMEKVILAAPIIEHIPDQTDDLDLFVRAVMTGDLLYAIPSEQRDCFDVSSILEWRELEQLAKRIGQLPSKENSNADVTASIEASSKAIVLGVTGTPMCLSVLNDGILDELEKEYTILRAPLIEYLYFLWKENGCGEKKGKLLAGHTQVLTMEIIETIESHMKTIGALLGKRNSFSTDIQSLSDTADQYLRDFAGGNGRYRFAKTLELAKRTDAMLTVAPRYENVSIILQMRGLKQACTAPLYEIEIDHDWDETAWSKLRAFLYYVKL